MAGEHLEMALRAGLEPELVPTGTWTRRRDLLDAAVYVLRSRVLADVGDASRERLFRMNATLCLHRGLTLEEEQTIGPACAVHLAGAPVEVLWERGVRGRPGAQPCENPRRQRLPGARDPRLWLPIDCGDCEPCRARAEITESVST